MSDLTATYIACGLTLALIVGVTWEKFAQSYRDVWGPVDGSATPSGL